jgi:hypothetical protein
MSATPQDRQERERQRTMSSSGTPAWRRLPVTGTGALPGAVLGALVFDNGAVGVSSSVLGGKAPRPTA